MTILRGVRIVAAVLLPACLSGCGLAMRPVANWRVDRGDPRPARPTRRSAPRPPPRSRYAPGLGQPAPAMRSPSVDR